MFTSAMLRPASALPMLAALLVTLSGVPAPAATVLSTEHYQKNIILTCGSVVCEGDFEKPGKKRRLTITRVSCFFGTVAPATFAYGYIKLRSDAGSDLLQQFLTGIHSNSNGNWHTLNNAVDMQVRASEHVRVTLVRDPGASAFEGNCTATGTLERLQ